MRPASVATDEAGEWLASFRRKGRAPRIIFPAIAVSATLVVLPRTIFTQCCAYETRIHRAAAARVLCAAAARLNIALPACPNAIAALGAVSGGVMKEFRAYGRGEEIADRYVHIVGLAAAVVGSAVLLSEAAQRTGALIFVSVAIYGVGLIFMIGASALYNHAGPSRRREWFRRLDHAAIFLMIAGTYTPFVLVRMGGPWGLGIAGFVWLAAIAGVVLKLLYPRRIEGISIALYLALGWVIVV